MSCHTKKLREHKIKMWIVKIARGTAESHENICSIYFSQSIMYSNYWPANLLSKRGHYILSVEIRERL